MPVYTKTAAEVFDPTTPEGANRGASMAEAQTWGTEIERAVAAESSTRASQVADLNTTVSTFQTTLVTDYVTKDDLSAAELAGANVYNTALTVTGGNVVATPFQADMGRVTAPSLDASQGLVGGLTKDFGLYAPAGIRGYVDAEDPETFIDNGDLVATAGGFTFTISGAVYPFKSVRPNGRALVSLRQLLAWPGNYARMEGLLNGMHFPIDENAVMGMKGFGQSDMAGTKGFIAGTFTIADRFVNPPGNGRITMMRRDEKNTDERGTYNRSNATGYEPWVETDFTGVEEIFGFGGPGSIHGVSPLLSAAYRLSEYAMADIGRCPVIHIDNTAVGGFTLDLLGPNPSTTGNVNATDNPRNDDVLATQMAYDYWLGAGKKYYVGVVLCKQGAAEDRPGDGTVWSGDWQTVRTDRITQYKSITGQPYDPLFVWTQESACRDESVGRGFQSTLGQWIEHQAGRLVLAGPDYAVRVFNGYADDNQHFNGVTGYPYLAEYMMRALRYLWRDGAYDPLHVASAVWDGATSIVVTLAGTDVSDIAIDSSLMSDPGQKGLRVFDEGNSDNEVTVSDVSRTGVMELTLTLAAAPTGTLRLDCGLTGFTSDFGTTNPDGYPASEMARTCIRSTDSFESYSGDDLHHWLIHQRVTGITTA